VACEAYKALVEKFGGIPTGTTEAGTTLYRQNGQVGFANIISNTAPPGTTPSLDGLYKIPYPLGAVLIGFIHTHPYTIFNAFPESGKPISTYAQQARANVSTGDIEAISSRHVFYPPQLGYVTTPDYWKVNQIIRFQPTGGTSASYQIIDCSKL
jgi:hypothetical protein